LCSNCGEVIPKDSNFCKGCGARLNGSEKLYKSEIDIVTPEKASAVQKSTPAKRSLKNVNQSETAKGKQISAMQIVYLIIGLVLVGLVLLYVSGAIGTGSSEAKVQNGNQTGSDVKLESIQEINQQEELVKNNPNDLDNLLKLGHMLNDAGFYEKAIERYKQYLKLKPNIADVIVDMGVCYFQTGKYDNAVSNFKKGIEINPEHQIAHMNLGVVYKFGLNNKTEAVKWWKKAVQLDPTSEVGKKAQDFLNQNK
jgi:tetratricopeptide (TPR) repeat protein